MNRILLLALLAVLVLTSCGRPNANPVEVGKTDTPEVTVIKAPT